MRVLPRYNRRAEVIAFGLAPILGTATVFVVLGGLNPTDDPSINRDATSNWLILVMGFLVAYWATIPAALLYALLSWAWRTPGPLTMLLLATALGAVAGSVVYAEPDPKFVSGGGAVGLIIGTWFVIIRGIGSRRAS
jgi:hypothetical protein